MAIPSRQIGWGTESNLLWQILKQITRLTSTLFSLKEATTPKYKVYTALLTQSGGSDSQFITSGDLTIGVTYFIDDAAGGDWTNVGAQNNNSLTYFVATGTTPNAWNDGVLKYNTGAPVVTVLENTIGNIWLTYDSVGRYNLNSNGLFTLNQTYSVPYMYSPLADLPDGIFLENLTVNYSQIISMFNASGNDDQLNNTPIEIRVYN
jgi:hypothetical protein